MQARKVNCPRCGKATTRVRTLKEAQWRECACGFSGLWVWEGQWLGSQKAVPLKQQAKNDPGYQEFLTRFTPVVERANQGLPARFRHQLLVYEAWQNPEFRANAEEFLGNLEQSQRNEDARRARLADDPDYQALRASYGEE